MNSYELDAYNAIQRRREELAEAARDRELLAESPDALPVSRRAARPVGRGLVALGSWLLRYGQSDGGLQAKL